MKQTWKLRFGLGLAAFGVFVALAAGSLSLKLDSFRVEQVENAEGKRVERLVPAAEVKPGDVLEWVLRATNEGERALEDVALTVPIPPNTVYLEGTARPIELEGTRVLPVFSYDGVRFAPPPLVRKVRKKVGDRWVEVEEVVPPEAYTHVRWVLPRLDPKQSVEARFRTKVR